MTVRSVRDAPSGTQMVLQHVRVTGGEWGSTLECTTQLLRGIAINCSENDRMSLIAMVHTYPHRCDTPPLCKDSNFEQVPAPKRCVVFLFVCGLLNSAGHFCTLPLQPLSEILRAGRFEQLSVLRVKPSADENTTAVIHDSSETATCSDCKQ